MSGQHGVPTTGELVAAVREFLEQEVVPGDDARVGYLARVAANVLAQCERELALGPGHAAAHAARLAALGVADDAALVAAIRAGALDDRAGDVLAAVRADAVDKLQIGNPRHLLPEDRQSS